MLRQVEVCLRRRTFTASGNPFDHNRPHVLRLTLDGNPPLRSIFASLPKVAQEFIAIIGPEPRWLSAFVRKKLKPNWDDEFDNEKSMYIRLEALQGRLIPHFHGEVKCDGTRALILSEVDGVPANKQPAPYLSPEVSRQRIEAGLKEPAAYGVSFDDTKLSNIMLVDNGIVFVDLESVLEPKDEQELEYMLMIYSLQFMDNYSDYMRHQERISAEAS